MAQQMSVADLPPQQLQKLAEQLNQETTALQDSFQQIGGVKGKFEASSRAIDRLTKQEDGAEILVPLTESLYVPAQLATSENLMVDIGTGYYVDKVRPTEQWLTRGRASAARCSAARRAR